MGAILCPERAYTYDEFILLRCVYAPRDATEFSVDGYGHVLEGVGKILQLPTFGICPFVVLQLEQHLLGLDALGGYAVVHQEFLDLVINLFFRLLVGVFTEWCKVYGQIGRSGIFGEVLKKCPDFGNRVVAVFKYQVETIRCSGNGLSYIFYQSFEELFVSISDKVA